MPFIRRALETKGIRQNNVVGKWSLVQGLIRLTRLGFGGEESLEIEAEDYYNGEFDPGSG